MGQRSAPARLVRWRPKAEPAADHPAIRQWLLPLASLVLIGMLVWRWLLPT